MAPPPLPSTLDLFPVFLSTQPRFPSFPITHYGLFPIQATITILFIFVAFGNCVPSHSNPAACSNSFPRRKASSSENEAELPPIYLRLAQIRTRIEAKHPIESRFNTPRFNLTCTAIFAKLQPRLSERRSDGVLRS